MYKSARQIAPRPTTRCMSVPPYALPLVDCIFPCLPTPYGEKKGITGKDICMCCAETISLPPGPRNRPEKKCCEIPVCKCMYRAFPCTSRW
jgi:hypothetical protein